MCEPCSADCSQCSFTEGICAFCNAGYKLAIDGTCVVDCEDVTPGCATCSGGVCATCQDLFTRDTSGDAPECIPDCPSASYWYDASVSDTMCVACDATCEECDPDTGECMKCRMVEGIDAGKTMRQRSVTTGVSGE